MSKYTNITQTLMAMSTSQDNVIVVHREFVKLTGSLECGMLLGQLLYWTPRTTLDGGWIAKTDEDLIDELGLSRYAIRTARERLEKAAILDTCIRKFDGNPTVHYKLNLGVLEQRWTNYLEESQTKTLAQTIVRNRTNDNAKSHEPLSEIELSITSETTSKITAEIEEPPNLLLAAIKETGLKLGLGLSSSLRSQWDSTLTSLLNEVMGAFGVDYAKAESLIVASLNSQPLQEGLTRIYWRKPGFLLQDWAQFIKKPQVSSGHHGYLAKLQRDFLEAERERGPWDNREILWTNMLTRAALNPVDYPIPQMVPAGTPQEA